LLPGLAAAQAPPLTATVTVAGRYQLTPPPGWTVKDLGETGMLLQPPEPAAWPLEIAVWPIPGGGQPAAVAAAAAQETALYRLAPYARTAQEDFVAGDGWSGLAVTGQIRHPDGKPRESVFVAFADEARFLVIGTFCEPGGAAQILHGDLGSVARSLVRLTPPPVAPAPPPGPAPVLPPARETPPPVAGPPVPPLVTPGEAPLPTLPAPLPTLPAPPAATGPKATPEPAALPLLPTLPPPVTPPVTPAPVPPVTPEPATPAPPQWISETPAPGLRVSHPADWRAVLINGRAEVRPAAAGAEPPATCGAFYWPWGRVPVGMGAAELARRVLGEWELVGAAAAGLAVRPEGAGVVLAGTVGPAPARRRLVAYCVVNGQAAALTGLYCAPEEFAARAPDLARVAASFTGGPWWLQAPREARGLTTWVDMDFGVLQVPTPPGWKIEGSVARANGVWGLRLQAVSADGRLAARWAQPALPFARELTPVLANLGWQEGDRYVNAPGEEALRVMRRLSPEAFATQVWLAQGGPLRGEVTVEETQARPEVATLAPGAQGQGAQVRLRTAGPQGPGQRLCLVAVADAPEIVGAHCWQGAVLEAEGPVGQAEQALAALRTMVSGAEVAPGNPAVPVEALADLLRRARLAVSGLPAPAGETPGLAAVLTALGPAGQGTAWAQPPQALALWPATAAAFVSTTVPELGADFWK
jgi:nucleotide-binding universal stress UspA family protein